MSDTQITAKNSQERVCSHCGCTFRILNKNANRGQGSYCTRDCYERWRSRPLEQRFWEKVDKTQPIFGTGQTTNCWVWTAYISKPHTRGSAGYGEIQVEGHHQTAHRVSWEIHFGAIPDGLMVLHKCDVRHCVRPDHLFLGTTDDNMADMVRKGRSTHDGHPPLKLSDEQVREIRSLAKCTPHGFLASMYGVSKSMISGIGCGRFRTKVL